MMRRVAACPPRRVIRRCHQTLSFAAANGRRQIPCQPAPVASIRVAGPPIDGPRAAGYDDILFVLAVEKICDTWSAVSAPPTGRTIVRCPGHPARTPAPRSRSRRISRAPYRPDPATDDQLSLVTAGPSLGLPR